jgi:hypothetical protein
MDEVGNATFDAKPKGKFTLACKTENAGGCVGILAFQTHHINDFHVLSP